jgi:Uma2 family endonuclease
MGNAVTQRRVVRIGPQDDGRRMSFRRFQRAEGQEGYRYELASGVIEVTDVPGRIHARVLFEIERQLWAFDHRQTGVIEHMAGGGFAKTEMPEMESERHPDYSVYLTPMPDDEYLWDKWTPTIAIEVVSAGSKARKRDYVTKRAEFLAAGILEYWIIDPQERQMLALTRHGDQWREQKLGERGKWSTPLLPGFTLELTQIFAVLDKPSAK